MEDYKLPLRAAKGTITSGPAAKIKRERAIETRFQSSYFSLVKTASTHGIAFDDGRVSTSSPTS
jgi:hypothetical protein